MLQVSTYVFSMFTPCYKLVLTYLQSLPHVTCSTYLFAMLTPCYKLVLTYLPCLPMLQVSNYLFVEIFYVKILNISLLLCLYKQRAYSLSIFIIFFLFIYLFMSFYYKCIHLLLPFTTEIYKSRLFVSIPLISLIALL